jgi:hypothetical protein
MDHKRQMQEMCMRGHGSKGFITVLVSIFGERNQTKRFIANYSCPTLAMFRADGGWYQGGFAQGQQDGFGMCVWPAGQTYVGEWQMGMMTGTGGSVTPNFQSNNTFCRISNYRHQKYMLKIYFVDNSTLEFYHRNVRQARHGGGRQFR